MDLIDGYDELPSEAQAKVKRALEQGHVDDDDTPIERAAGVTDLQLVGETTKDFAACSILLGAQMP